jgi:hypothetical protein
MAKGKKYRNLWEVVRRIIIEDHENLVKHRLRESFYLVRNRLSLLIGKDISQEEFDYFASTKQAYCSYRDDIWPSLEQKKGLQRPEAKPYGTIYENGHEYSISQLSRIWNQARGFIFTEKLEDGEDLRKLSNYGWTIIAGGGFAGFPTRQIRQMLKNDTRPIYAFHDADVAGNGIYRALGFQTRRTVHLDIALGDRVTDLGLNAEDAHKLNLPTEPEPRKHKERRRVETAALALLEETMKLENPKLAYVVAKMLVLGTILSPTEKPKVDILLLSLKTQIDLALYTLISDAVIEAIKELKPKGKAVYVDLPRSEEIIMEDLKDLARELAIKLGKQAKWLHERDYHREATKLTTPELTGLLEM